MIHQFARWNLILLVMLLIFEGLIRKLLPGILSDLFLFAKDVLVLPLVFYVLRQPLQGVLGKIFRAYLVLLVLILPLAGLTAAKDPVLSIFGLKQYLLYPWVAFAWVLAFLRAPATSWRTPYRVIGYCFFFTTAVALIQLNLPSNHWVNLGVDGSDLSGFSAGGFLRVSSTFSFLAQYNYFLLFLPASLAICHLWRKRSPIDSLAFSIFIIVSLYILSIFITGSRTSVLGGLVILILAIFLFLQKARKSLFPKVFGIAVALYIGFNIMSAVFPQAFAVYAQRSAGREGISHTQELLQRIGHSYTIWWSNLLPKAGLTGFGLGSMSNGVQKISDYAANIRMVHGWGETDMANTMLEGGLYLVVVWKGFRLYIIYCCWILFRRISGPVYILPGAFFLSHIILEGVNGTLGIQPPLAIWFWISVGSIILIYRMDYKRKIERAKRARAKAKPDSIAIPA
jgi:hypothetical protein